MSLRGVILGWVGALLVLGEAGNFAGASGERSYEESADGSGRVVDSGAYCSTGPSIPIQMANRRNEAEFQLRYSDISRDPSDPFFQGLTQYLENVCTYNQGRNECLGTAEGLSTAVLDVLGIQVKSEAWRPSAGREGQIYPSVHYEAMELDRQLQGKTLKELGRNYSSLKVGQLIHTKCHTEETGVHFNGYDRIRAHDAHHWVVYAGLIDGQPRFFDNSAAAMFKGKYCKPCLEQLRSSKAWSRIPEKRCESLQTCLKACRAKHERSRSPDGTWCNPKRPWTCLMSMYSYKNSMKLWDATAKYCGEGTPGEVRIYGVRDPLSTSVR